MAQDGENDGESALKCCNALTLFKLTPGMPPIRRFQHLMPHQLGQELAEISSLCSEDVSGPVPGPVPGLGPVPVLVPVISGPDDWSWSRSFLVPMIGPGPSPVFVLVPVPNLVPVPFPWLGYQSFNIKKCTGKLAIWWKLDHIQTYLYYISAI